MLKRIILILLITIGLSANAAENFLNSVVIDNNDGQMSIVLRADKIVKVRKEIESPDKITLYLKGIEQSPDINTLYKNTSQANTVIVENAGNNSLKIHIQAKDIANSNIIFDTPASAPVVVTDSVSHNTIVWSIVAFVVLCGLFARTLNIKEDSESIIQEAINKDMRDREIEMYKNYRKELLTIPSIDYKIKNPRVQETIRRADTIRHLQRNAK